LALVGAVLLFAGELAWVFGAAASLGTWDEQSLADIVASPGGRVMGLLMGAALGLWALLGIEGRPRARAVAIAALGVAVCAVDGGSGHVVRDAPAFATVLLNGLHEAAMAGWVGGVAAVVIGAVAARAALPVAVAGATVGVVSGGILALVHIPEVTLLVRSDYGRALVLKLFVVGAAVLLGAVAWRRRRPEAIALLAVLAAAGLLASLPPPR
jgi:copper transport protein